MLEIVCDAMYCDKRYVNYMSHLELQELTIGSWKADRYRINSGENLPRISTHSGKEASTTPCIEAAPDALWTHLNPFDFYRQSEGGRDAEAGPHLKFLRLKSIAREKPYLLDKGIMLFAQEYGLLGNFPRRYLPQPVVRRGKRLIAPEAVLDSSGALRKVDPATEGVELLLAMQREHRFSETFPNELSEELFRYYVALPEEVRLITPRGRGQSRKITPWEEARRDLGALFVLTPGGSISPVCSREPLRWWKRVLDAFPTPREVLTGDLTQLPGVQPVFAPEQDGYLNPGWVCDSLLSAMHLMLCLDLSGESTIQKCQSRGCPEYFRVGPYSRARYCSSRCASRATTRRYRGREPQTRQHLN